MFWLLIVIPIIIFVVSVMLKGLAPKAPGGEDDAVQPDEQSRRTRPTATDVERFLAEINRRKREAEHDDTRDPAPRREPRRERRQRQPATAQSARTRPVTVLRISEEEASRLPVVQAVEDEPVSVEPAPPPVHLQPMSKPASPLLKEVLPLLRSARGRKAAMVLQEIFGPPKCRRLMR
jgi:hypothetical protein